MLREQTCEHNCGQTMLEVLRWAVPWPSNLRKGLSGLIHKSRLGSSVMLCYSVPHGMELKTNTSVVLDLNY